MGWIIVVAIYILLVVYFFIYVGPWILGATAIFFGIWFVGEYVRTMYSVMAEDPPSKAAPLLHPPPASPTHPVQPAFRQYFFGQAIADLRHTMETAGEECKAISRRGAAWISDKFFENEDLMWLLWPGGVVAWIGLAIGVVGGAAIFLVFAAVHAVVVLVVQAVALAVALVLRAIDTATLKVRRIRITCPACYQRIEFPEYDCPSTSCALRHTDVRPGRYGVFRRSCACLTAMPTVLILGSHRLDAFCPHCGEALAEGTGTAPQVVLPVMGGTAAGKTRLMASIILALEEMTGEHGATLAFADEHTKREFDRQRKLLVAGQSTRATQVGQAPRAYSVYVEPPSGSRRLVHMFDPAGELHDSTERMQELQYIKEARSFLFVLDPLSVSAYWRSLSDDERTELEQSRPDPRILRPPDVVFQTSRDNVARMGVDTKKARLAVSLSKYDILADKSGHATIGTTSDSIEKWLQEELGLGNLVRSMRHNFREVAFFATAAVRTDDGVDDSVLELVRWLLRGERLYLTTAAEPAEATT